jgi:2-(1,2-epoxy-1,2-dihydrophenyl)acetyl-CoA isomerase
MSYEAILVDKSEGIGTVTMNRPEKLNAHTRQMGKEIRESFLELDADPEIGAIIFTGAGRGFCAGADMGGFQARIDARSQGQAAAQTSALSPENVNFNHLVRGLGIPVIAAVNGAAVGVGFTMTLCCDIRLAAESARMSAIFVRRGVTPEVGSSFNLPRLLGLGRAMEMVLTGKLVSGQEAADIGLVNHVYPDDELIPAARELAKNIVKNAPLAIRWSRDLLFRGLDGSLDSQLVMERHIFDRATKTEDHAEAVRAFLEKRDATFYGR